MRGKPIYLTRDEIWFLYREALEDVPESGLTQEQIMLLQELKKKFYKAVYNNQ